MLYGHLRLVSGPSNSSMVSGPNNSSDWSMGPTNLYPASPAKRTLPAIIKNRIKNRERERGRFLQIVIESTDGILQRDNRERERILAVAPFLEFKRHKRKIKNRREQTWRKSHGGKVKEKG